MGWREVNGERPTSRLRLPAAVAGAQRPRSACARGQVEVRIGPPGLWTRDRTLRLPVQPQGCRQFEILSQLGEGPTGISSIPSFSRLGCLSSHALFSWTRAGRHFFPRTIRPLLTFDPSDPSVDKTCSRFDGLDLRAVFEQENDGAPSPRRPSPAVLVSVCSRAGGGCVLSKAPDDRR